MNLWKNMELMENEGMRENPGFEGFNRILIDENQAVSPRKAYEMGFEPEVGFMRKDGWCLGAPFQLEYAARRLWQGEWTHTIRKGETEWTPIK